MGRIRVTEEFGIDINGVEDEMTSRKEGMRFRLTLQRKPLLKDKWATGTLLCFAQAEVNRVKILVDGQRKPREKEADPSLQNEAKNGLEEGKVGEVKTWIARGVHWRSSGPRTIGEGQREHKAG